MVSESNFLPLGSLISAVLGLWPVRCELVMISVFSIQCGDCCVVSPAVSDTFTLVYVTTLHTS